MRLKNAVDAAGVQPPIYYAIGVAEAVYRFSGWKLVVTSLTDAHADRPASLHNKGLAVDMRTNGIPADIVKQILGGLAAILNPMGFDVALESDHIHVEFDPKQGERWSVTVA